VSELGLADVRPRDRGATERRILTEAVRLFADQGYTHVTVRAIAGAAGVNVSLINRYYGSKLGLFAAVLDAGDEPPRLPEVPFEELPRRLAEYATRSRGSDAASLSLSAATRSVEVPEVRELLRVRLEGQLVVPLARRLSGPEARARAALCVALLIGTGSVRRILDRDEPATPEYVDRLTAVIAGCLA
jgi:AcrR family transcriptional regulator